MLEDPLVTQLLACLAGIERRGERDWGVFPLPLPPLFCANTQQTILY